MLVCDREDHILEIHTADKSFHRTHVLWRRIAVGRGSRICRARAGIGGSSRLCWWRWLLRACGQGNRGCRLSLCSAHTTKHKVQNNYRGNSHWHHYILRKPGGELVLSSMTHYLGSSLLR